MKTTVVLNQKISRSILMPIILAIFAILGSFNAAQADSQINWKDVTSGLQDGKYEGKYVLVDVYTDWCIWCKRLDKDTFTDQSFIDFVQSKFVCVKANAEDHGAGQKLALEYGVNGFPCALIFDRNGKMIGRISGFKDAQTYEAALTNILDNPNSNN